MTDKTTAMTELPEPELGYIETDKSRQPAFSARQMREALQSAQPAAAVSDAEIDAAVLHATGFDGIGLQDMNRLDCRDIARAILALRPQAVPMTDARDMSVAFHLTRDQLPRLVNRTSSYGGVWSSRLCVVIGKDGHFSMSQLNVSDATKARIDAGEPIPRNRFNIDFKGGGSDFYDKTCFAWAYLDDVVSILNGITQRADGGEVE